MERINLLRKNLVYPERLELAAMMRGPRAAGGEGSWRPTNTEDGWGHAPRTAWDDPDIVTPKSNTWMQMAANFRKNNQGRLTMLRQTGSPATEIPQLTEAGATSRDAGQEPHLLLSICTGCNCGGSRSPLFRSSRDPAARDRMSELLRRFAERAAASQARMEMPLTPSSESSPSPTLMRRRNDREEVVKPVNVRINTPPPRRRRFPCLKFWDYEKCKITFDPHGVFYLIWLLAVTLSYCYNSWVIPMRWSFPYQTPDNTPVWLLIDAFCDLIYLIDVAVIKPRVRYLSEGFWVSDPLETRTNYTRKTQFKLDLVSLLPLEILYLQFGSEVVLLRIPRLLKVQTFSEFYISLDRLLASPFIVRVGRTLAYIFYLIHLNACAYYKVSTWEGIGSNGWVFSGIGNAYIRCFYFATKTATSIGKNPKPENEMEYIFMTFAWLMGVFVFALLISQIRDIIATATRSQTEYKRLVDETMEYMRRQNLPNDIQRRVCSWFKFTYDQQNTLDESHIINSLPMNMKTDVAINVHIQTLSKVQLFTDCDEALLRDLVLKLRPVIFLPGDIICRKGEVGKEMYIVRMGEVHVMGGEKDNEVLATLSEGSVFGEISLLGINGANRRTADVRSNGYSNLFVLNKADLNSALVYHPEAQEILRKKANNLMKKNATRKKSPEPDIIIGNPRTPVKEPRLLQAVLEALPEESGAGQLLRLGSKRCNKKKSMKQPKQQQPTVPRLAPPRPQEGCTCEDQQRRKTLPKGGLGGRRGKKAPGCDAFSGACTNIYKMRNSASEPSLQRNSKCCTKKEE